MNSLNSFVSHLSKIQCIANAKKVAIEEWGEDIPDTLLLSLLGKAIAGNFTDLENDERRLIFDHIEWAMSSGDEYLPTLVATGMLEAIDGYCIEDPALKNSIYAYFGVKARAYLDALNKWYYG